MADTPTPQNNSDVNVSALEEELNKTISSDSEAFSAPHNSPEEPKTLKDKVVKLQNMENVIETRSHQLESEIKTKLTTLKSLKQSIELGLQKIKNFGSEKTKIQQEIQKIQKLESDQLEIETEIKSIEDHTKEMGI